MPPQVQAPDEIDEIISGLKAKKKAPGIIPDVPTRVEAAGKNGDEIDDIIAGLKAKQPPAGPGLMERIVTGAQKIYYGPRGYKLHYGTPEEQESVREAMTAKQEELRARFPGGVYVNKRTGELVPRDPNATLIPGMDMVAGLIPIGKLVRAEVMSSDLYDHERGQLVLPGDPNQTFKVPLGMRYGTVSVPKWVGEAALNTVVGLGQVSADVVEGLSSPANIALLTGIVLLPEVGALAMVKTAVEAGFSLEMASNAVDTIQRGFEEAKKGNIVQAGELFSSAIVTSVFAVLAGKAAATRTGRLLRVKARIKAEHMKEGMAEPDAEVAAEREAGKTTPPPAAPEVAPLKVPEVPVRGGSPQEIRATLQAEIERLQARRGEALGEDRVLVDQRIAENRKMIAELGEAEISTLEKSLLEEARREGRTVTKVMPDGTVIRTAPPGRAREIFDLENRLVEKGKLTQAEVPLLRKFAITLAEDAGRRTEMSDAYVATLRRLDSIPTDASRTAVRGFLAEAELPSAGRKGAAAEARVEFNETLNQATGAPIEEALLGGGRKQIAEGKPAPPTVTKGKVKRGMELIVRGKVAELAAQRERGRAALKQARNHFDRLPEVERLEFIDRMETGRPQTTAAETAFAGKMRTMLDSEWGRVLQRKPGLETWIRNYFPHLWKNTKTARTVFARRPLLGTKSFLKKRKFPTLKQGMEWAREQGVALEPITTNPVDMVLMKLHEMRKFTTGQDIMELGKAMGIVRFVPAKLALAGRQPKGFTQIKDPVGTVWGSGKVKVQEAFDEILFEGLNDFARSLGIEHIRKVSLGRGKEGVLGYTMHGTKKVWTKFAGPETVLTHELGHQLDFRYPEFREMLKDKVMVAELRDLADLRYEGKENLVSPYFKKYVRAGSEKIANLIHAYVHAPEKLRYAAPNAYSRLIDTLRTHEELKPLMDIKPSLVMKGVTAQKDIPGMQVLGYWYAPEAAAGVLNRHLSPGLWRPGTTREKIGRAVEEVREGDYMKAMEEGSFAAYDLYRYSGNLMNQVQLGVGSMFHFTFTAMDTATSSMALGIQKLARGKVGEGLKDVVHGDIVLGPWLSWFRGNRMMKEFYEPGSQGEVYAAAIDNLIKAGGRTKMDQFYLNSSVANFWAAFREGSMGKAALHTVPATIEYLARPIMQAWVPRLKMGAFSKLAEFELEKLGPNADWFAQRDVLARAWDSIDNRLGQLTYDNLFWNRVMKDVGMMSVRSLGWNIGTFRELGGGVIDLGKALRKPELTPRLAYTLAYPLVIGLHGAMVQYLLTGLRPGERNPEMPPDSPDPDPITDMAFPRSGRVNPDGTEERTSIPGYHKDVYQYFKGFPLGLERGVRQFATVLRHKMHPMVSAIIEMMNNEDFHGEEIRNVEDPWVQQLKDTMEFTATLFTPFWVRNVRRRMEAGGGIVEGLESALGILPAPATIYRSRAEQLAGIYMGEMLPKGAMTEEQAERRRLRRDLVRQAMTGDANYRENVRQAIIDEKIGRRDLRLIYNALRERPLERMVMRLSLERALNVFDLASPDEQDRLRRILLRKQRTLFDMDPEVAAVLRRRLDAALGRVPRGEGVRAEEVPAIPLR